MQQDSLLGKRKVSLWTPDHFRLSTPILIAHDGQNCFDGSHSLSGFGWELDKAALGIREAGLPEPLILAPWNADEKRIMEYTPEEILRSNPKWLEAYQSVTEEIYEPCGNAYIDWLVENLLPWAASEFGIELSRNRTALLGSSLGGLVSITALSRYPDVFEGALCVSTHWTIEDIAFAKSCVDQLPPPGNHRLWLDYGDSGLETEALPIHQYVDKLLKDAGWSEYIVHTVFPGTDHTERDWRLRAFEILKFWISGIQ